MKFVSTFNAVHLNEDPSVASDGELYFNSASNVFRYYTSGSWNNLITSSDISNINPSVYTIGDVSTASLSLILNESYINSILVVYGQETVNITIPSDDELDAAIGSNFRFIKAGEADFNFIEDGGVIINMPSSIFLTSEWSTASIIKINENTWLVDSEFPDLY